MLCEGKVRPEGTAERGLVEIKELEGNGEGVAVWIWGWEIWGLGDSMGAGSSVGEGVAGGEGGSVAEGKADDAAVTCGVDNGAGCAAGCAKEDKENKRNETKSTKAARAIAKNLR